MRKQDNYLIVDGTDVLQKFGLVLTDDYTLGVPQPKHTTVDVPGGDGTIDLTEFSGGVRYADRSQTFRLAIIGNTQQGAEYVRSRLAAFLDGKRASYQIGIDPGFTYCGRFSVGAMARSNRVSTVEVTVDARPWKTAGLMTLVVNAAGGVTFDCVNGDREVCPTIEVRRHSIVSYSGVSYEIEAGAHQIAHLLLQPGLSQITIDTYPDYTTIALSDISARTLHDLQDAYSTLAAVAAGDTPVNVPSPLSSYKDATLTAMGGAKHLFELSNPAVRGDEYSAYVQFERQYL